MNLTERLDEDFKDALRSRDSERLGVLRLVRSAIKNFEIEKQGEASDEDVIALLQREIKQHRETIAGLQKAGRIDDLPRQEAEIAILLPYLPAQLSEAELKDLIEQAIGETKATSVGDVGRVMGTIMPRVRGRATGDAVGQMVRDLLADDEKA